MALELGELYVRMEKSVTALCIKSALKFIEKYDAPFCFRNRFTVIFATSFFHGLALIHNCKRLHMTDSSIT